MRTKHLFYTAAMAALFAACVNDDFETIGQQGNVANDGRPVAGDVKLNFTKAGADTRLAFGSNGYAWEASDEIGALLMDNVKSLNEEDSWLQKYELIPEIHTSYRFYYDSENKEWKADAKMLEGNYFFAYPWEDYDGRRQVAHSLINQEQDGIGGNVVAESYADNQFFIGYSQIKAGTGVNEVLDSSVEMVPLLGAIQLRITNTGTQTYHINKVVLSNHEGLASVLTFDPTTAEYGEWNLDGNNNVAWTQTANKFYFNYANYLGIDGEAELYVANTPNPTKENGDYVYNREDGDEYSRIEALRKVVKPLGDPEKSAQIVINGTADERAILPGVQNTAYVLVMCNPLEEVKEATNFDKSKTLYLSIYTDEGFVQNIDLGKIYNESTENKVTTNAKITEVGPNVSNTITIQIDDNSFITPDEMEIFNSADLEQFIKWNVSEDATRNMKATLMQDITLTADMVEMLLNDKKPGAAKGQTTLTLVGIGEIKVTLAADVPADVLDNEEIVLENVNLVVEGELALTEDSEKAASIEVAKDGKLTIDDPKAVVAGIDNYGTLTLGAKSAVKDINIDNYGTMEVVKGGDSKAEVTNKKDAVINNNGYMQGVTNEKDATIVLGENATLAGVNNSGKIETAKGATVTGDNNTDGEIVFVDGADISGLGTNNGKTSIVYDGTTITKDTKFENINKIILTKSVTVTDDYTFAGEVELQNNGVLSVNEGKTFTIESLLVSGEGTVSGKGTVEVANVEVEEEGVLNNSGVIQANAEFRYEGTVYNNGTIYTNNLVNVDNKGTWKYNDEESIPAEPEDKQQTTMDAAVTTWASLWNTYLGNAGQYGKYYSGDPYDVNAFIESLNEWYTNTNSEYHSKATGLYAQWCKADDDTKDSFEKVLKDAQGNANSKFTAAVDKVVTPDNWTALKKVIINTDGAFTGFTMPTADATLYDTETEAYDAFAKSVAIAEIGNVEDARVKAAIWKATDIEIADALAKTEGGEYIYIWKGCKLDKVMAVYRMISIEEWDVALHGEKTTWTEEVKTIANLKHWMSTVLNSENVNNSYVKEAKEVVEEYISEYQTWEYSDGQIKSAGK